MKDKKLKVQQEKCYRNITNGTIFVKEELYTLMLTSIKRELIFEKNKFIDTKPKII